MNAIRRRRIAWNKEVEARATALASPRSHASHRELGQELPRLGRAMLKHPFDETSFVGAQVSVVLVFVHRTSEQTPNDRKLSDTPERRGTCMAGGKAAVEAGVVTRRRVRCSAWLGDVGLDGVLIKCSL